ncbi:DUF922 domain-containing Zn-dependent protease [Mangrovibrevibacter kandeliae]|uniref:DUF922 domain-containing Zn-dependent protease n=1 Tax=Mangrovibrevibacter kandeliae TaxID=2968473 RepID=UPI0021176D4A|nr:DUF922 domain-containing protein [Aurantimonas sp. CSK15Z-1]MCQ8782787.1 DUF922 domain-containing protein [Aurantimonas sp. CSK15Z-1]
MTVASAAFALALVAGMAGTATAANISEKTTYFMVRGSTLDELDHDLTGKGPVVASTGLHHPGATSVRFDGHVTYKAAGGGCRVNKTNLRLDLVTTLPKWEPRTKVSARTRLVWNTLATDIRRHENHHAQIAKLWLKKMENAIRNLPAQRDCSAMEALVNKTSDRYLREHERAQIDFDTVEAREVNWRLKRALKRMMQASN